MKLLSGLCIFMLVVLVLALPSAAEPQTSEVLSKYTGKYVSSSGASTRRIEVINANSKKAVRLFMSVYDEKGNGGSDGGIAIFINDNTAKYVSDKGCSVILQFNDNKKIDVIENGKGRCNHGSQVSYEGIYSKEVN